MKPMSEEHKAFWKLFEHQPRKPGVYAELNPAIHAAWMARWTKECAGRWVRKGEYNDAALYCPKDKGTR